MKTTLNILSSFLSRIVIKDGLVVVSATSGFRIVVILVYSRYRESISFYMEQNYLVCSTVYAVGLSDSLGFTICMQTCIFLVPFCLKRCHLCLFFFSFILFCPSINNLSCLSFFVLHAITPPCQLPSFFFQALSLMFVFLPFILFYPLTYFFRLLFKSQWVFSGRLELG